MATGSGDSLGAALLDLAAELGGAPRKSTYTAKGWHAQISRLTATQAGYKAAERVGLTASERTLRGWLAGNEPNKANRELIAKAYTLAGAGKWPDWERKEFRIYGFVAQGDDRRERGTGEVAPLLIDGREAYPSTWAQFKDEWESGGGMSEDDVEDRFSDIIVDDIGGSDPWEFTGPAYTVTAI